MKMWNQTFRSDGRGVDKPDDMEQIIVHARRGSEAERIKEAIKREAKPEHLQNTQPTYQMGKIIASCGHELGPDEGPDGFGFPVSWEEYDGPDLVTCHATYCQKCAEALEAYQGAVLAVPSCSACGRPYEYSPKGYGHPTKCWSCAPTRLPRKH